MNQPETPQHSPIADLADLRRKSVRGGMITFVSQAASIAIQLASTVILARLLTPQDYGVMAMVVAVTAFAGLFRDMGLSTAAIQQPRLTHGHQSNLFWMNVALGAFLAIGLASASPLVAWFYHKREVLWVTVALSSTLLIGSLAAQSNALLVRNMWFGRQAAAGISGALAGLSISVVLALHGYRYWALVWGQLAAATVSTLILFLISPFRPGLPRRGTGVREMLKFGANITAFDFVNYFHRNLDNILIGRFWGAESLGLYSRAYALLLFPINNVRVPISAVGFPAMSRLQNQPAAYRNYYRRITNLLALASMPCTAFLFVSSGPVIRLALGARWAGVTPIFAILATVAFVQPVITLWGMVLLSRGMGRRYLYVGIANAALSAAGFLAGIRWGAAGVATAYAIVTYVSAYPILAWAFEDTPLRVRDFWASICRPMIASIFAAGISLALSSRLAQYEAALEALVLGAIFLPAFIIVLLCMPGGRLEIQRAFDFLPARLRLKWAAQ